MDDSNDVHVKGIRSFKIKKEAIFSSSNNFVICLAFPLVCFIGKYNSIVPELFSLHNIETRKNYVQITRSYHSSALHPTRTSISAAWGCIRCWSFLVLAAAVVAAAVAALWVFSTMYADWCAGKKFIRFALRRNVPSLCFNIDEMRFRIPKLIQWKLQHYTMITLLQSRWKSVLRFCVIIVLVPKHIFSRRK